MFRLALGFCPDPTVERNIRYGLERDVSLEEVREAARRASVDADIERLPGAYSFVLAEGGRNLSGGQRQRIALARVFLRSPRLLILDEATSALDNASEKRVQAEIEKLCHENGTTVIAIAHRLTTLQNCDAIVVLERGRVVQQGSFAALREAPGLFRNMAVGARPAEPEVSVFVSV
ncbi:MAG TPA: ATP-binding cassette domain-containing protein [Candidatus Pullichristensenella excrementipullorum]|nr:ATP-binding cassette domain-containing protein [Candidatus Pullichristensenella excrementipullorum]